MSYIDIIAPCYNYGCYLRECVESVLNQSIQDLRILIIDDASSDETSEVAADLVDQDSRVSYRRHSENCGHIATYNEGLEWASAKYLMLLSADDFLPPGALARAANLMDAHPEVGFVQGTTIDYYMDQSLNYYSVERFPTIPSEEETYKYTVKSGHDFISLAGSTSGRLIQATAIVRTTLHKKVGGFYKELPNNADLNLWLRCAACSAVGLIDGPQLVYRIHKKSMLRSTFSDMMVRYLQRQAAFDMFFAEYGSALPDRDRLQKQQKEALAGQAFWAALAQLWRGNPDNCKRLLDFAFSLCPYYRYWPPLASFVKDPSMSYRLSYRFSPRYIRSLLTSLATQIRHGTFSR